MSQKKPKLLVIVGPTASGKSDLAIALARKYDGEIISADSRQVYQGLDIGSGKVTKKERRIVQHHLLDVASPKKVYSVHDFQRDAHRAIRAIVQRGKVPILVGGTGFWIESVIGGHVMPSVEPNLKLRKRLQKLSAAKLYAIVRLKDPVRARTIDRHNPVRLIRALEIIEATGKPVAPLTGKQRYQHFILGVSVSQKKLYRNIHTRLQKRLKHGMLAEVRGLLKSEVPEKRLLAMGLEYMYCTLYLRGELSRAEFKKRLEKEIKDYAKRQMTWFRRMEKTYPIRWIRSGTDAVERTKQFIQK